MKSRNIVDDIGRHIHDLAVDGGLFLQVYSPHKDRIVSNVISMIIKDLQLGATRCAPLTIMEAISYRSLDRSNYFNL